MRLRGSWPGPAGRNLKFRILSFSVVNYRGTVREIGSFTVTVWMVFSRFMHVEYLEAGAVLVPVRVWHGHGTLLHSMGGHRHE